MSDVRWEGLTHEEIYARVQQGPGRLASADAEAAWATVESTIRAVDDQLTRAVKQIGVDWQGAAADAVQRRDDRDEQLGARRRRRRAR